ncbi:unnamed protein product [Chilo suppressalis]|uniref:Lipase domain-containing protein n=1 Tax=Chilo suppressalis TaxID=168631 RepID=A0ABN8L9U6_CHISP|nr:unnamed protein product [Chilo suppressalis]
MATLCGSLLVLGLAVVAALPTDPVIRKLDQNLRYQYAEKPDGSLQLVDLWMKVSDFSEVSRFSPDIHNVYHLFTRANPSVSQPLLVGNDGLLGSTNYDPSKRCIILIHGWLDGATSDFNMVLVPAFLAAEDVNVIVVDWSAGGGTINYATAVANTVPSGESVARFINWLNRVTGTTPEMFHLVGFSLGAHQVGVVGRNVGGAITYITGLDPAGPGWMTNDNRFRENDGVYTEIIHTNAGIAGFLATLGHTDFYPNGGVNMPGCGMLSDCSHARAIFYFAESIRGGVFRSRRCVSYVTAMASSCVLPSSVQMGGLRPKIGTTGIFSVETNEAPPFAKG